MAQFLESEKPFQAVFKKSSPYISDKAREDGIYKEKPRQFCLPLERAEENLIPEIRQSSLNHFAIHGIKWHEGQDGKPSNHMCDSQVCCVNFLFPFSEWPVGLANLMRTVFPNIERMLPVESGKYVSFEWIGAENYLGERISRSGIRTRGANFTSADAIVMFESAEKKKQVVLIEWKYTESYSGNSLKVSNRGTDRTKIYEHLFIRPDCPIENKLLPDFSDLFYEPFYQFMRQQFLAHEMEKANELGADVVSVLHIAPACNADFRKITSPHLQHLGDTATEVWKKLIKEESRFISISTESLFGGLFDYEMQEMNNWKKYIASRYRWMVKNRRGGS